ncbi:ABC transporter permease [Mesorhizobium sp. Root102]|uniref:ABC transporter permease n=1 Tax=Mesorhizobium sp. Root102 TaxID=1736422 RepID=UPI0006FC31F5|nr:ABC transporter permease [Mesorhizobium sp. Root102]KQU95558.1 ABC transporter permease [Mesorhizobium sp. Root102]
MSAQVGLRVKDRLKRSWKNSPSSLRIGATILTAHLLLALLGPWLAPYQPSRMGAGIALSGASFAHPFGLDQLGRDVLSRTLHGAWLVLTISLCGTFLGFATGGFIGLISGLVGGKIDAVVNRVMEALISIPVLFMALLVVTMVSQEMAGSILLIIAVIGAVFAPRVGRIARAASIEISARDYIVASRLRGDGASRVALREILPNASGTLLVEFALRAGSAPILVASLGFLGFGIRPPTPEWGLIISENRNLLFITPATVLGPGFLLASLVVGFNLITDGFARVVGLQAAKKD